MTEVPTMDEALRGAPKNWGKWGEEDEVGALNYLTTEEVFLMRNLGVALTEICDLEKLASHCAEDRQCTFLYTAAPLKVNEASGSPVNPLVIK